MKQPWEVYRDALKAGLQGVAASGSEDLARRSETALEVLSAVRQATLMELTVGRGWTRRDARLAIDHLDRALVNLDREGIDASLKRAWKEFLLRNDR